MVGVTVSIFSFKVKGQAAGRKIPALSCLVLQDCMTSWVVLRHPGDGHLGGSFEVAPPTVKAGLN